MLRLLLTADPTPPAPFLLPSFWRETFLASIWSGNPIWNYLLALLIILAALALRRPVAKVIQAVVRRICRKHESVEPSLSQALTPAFRLLILTLGLGLATQTNLLVFSERLTAWLGQGMATLRALVLCLLLMGIAVTLIEIRTDKARQEGLKEVVTIHTFYKRIVQVATVILGLFMALRIWGFDISGLLAGIGIGGLAISLAAQDTFANLLGGVTIMADHTFAIGDVISTPDIEGIVEAIGFRSSKIRTFAQAVVTVPNARLSNTFVTNLSRMGKRRIRFHIGLEYGTRPEQIRSLIERFKAMLAERESIYAEGILIHTEKFSPSSIDILFQCFVKTIEFPRFLQEQEAIILEIMRIMDEASLSFAFPALSVHLDSKVNRPSD
jgi:MscS family membrane protein